jgi:hypothetical protein
LLTSVSKQRPETEGCGKTEDYFFAADWSSGLGKEKEFPVVLWFTARADSKNFLQLRGRKLRGGFFLNPLTIAQIGPAEFTRQNMSPVYLSTYTLLCLLYICIHMYMTVKKEICGQFSDAV